ncbi:MAG: G-D-S-L family lipolytic protein [Mariniphaga sp.]|nr:G-D-S-L family lipolytic protein [Mariniphaga sp.]
MKSKIIIRIGLIFSIFFIVLFANAQDPLRFKNEINQFGQIEVNTSDRDNIVVFTGSSSVRMWKDVQSYFPGIIVINTGFGGSHMSDLLYFSEETILRFNPKKVFIYEGDNDIASEKSSEEILKTTKQLVNKIISKLPDLEIILISPKPSLARWKLKNEYVELNKKLEAYCKESNLEFANVWDIMLNDSNTPIKEIFIEDGLHMNKKGYDLWFNVLKDYFD